MSDAEAMVEREHGTQKNDAMIRFAFAAVRTATTDPTTQGA